MTPEIEIASAERLAERFAGRLAAAAAEAVAARARCRLALAGGSATTAFVPAWRQAAVDWSRVELFWVDERAVSPDHEDSNYGLARRSGLDELPLSLASVHPLTAAGERLEHAAERADRQLRAALGAAPRIDLALVGVGADGHVASLFPGHPALAEEERWVVAVDDAPKPPPRRLTWTLPAFALVDLLVVAAFGEAKAEAVAAAFGPAASGPPIACVVPLAARCLLLVDEAASRRIRRG